MLQFLIPPNKMFPATQRYLYLKHLIHLIALILLAITRDQWV